MAAYMSPRLPNPKPVMGKSHLPKGHLPLTLCTRLPSSAKLAEPLSTLHACPNATSWRFPTSRKPNSPSSLTLPGR